jgi:hypothetical protein
MADVVNDNFHSNILTKSMSPTSSGWLMAISTLSCLFLVFFISNSVLASGGNTTNGSGITGFSQNNSIRNLTNPLLKMEGNPLANLSNPLANLPNPLHNLTASQKSADLEEPFGR